MNQVKVFLTKSGETEEKKSGPAVLQRDQSLIKFNRRSLYLNKSSTDPENVENYFIFASCLLVLLFFLSLSAKTCCYS